MLAKKKVLSPEDNARKKQASELLKSADKFMKAGDIDNAIVEIDKTIELDPQNFYARANKERLRNMKKGGRPAAETAQASGAQASGPQAAGPLAAAEEGLEAKGENRQSSDAVRRA